MTPITDGQSKDSHASPQAVRSGTSTFRLDVNLHIWGRNCDRSVQGSPSLEAFDQLDALLVRDAF